MVFLNSYILSYIYQQKEVMSIKKSGLLLIIVNDCYLNNTKGINNNKL